MVRSVIVHQRAQTFMHDLAIRLQQENRMTDKQLLFWMEKQVANIRHDYATALKFNRGIQLEPSIRTG